MIAIAPTKAESEILERFGFKVETAYKVVEPCDYWTSVESRLPDIGLEVLVYDEQDTPGHCLAVYHGGGEWRDSNEGLRLPHVTHWRFLPPRPEGGVRNDR